MDIFLIWIGVAFVAAFVAGGKRRDCIGWFILCLLFPIAIVVLLTLPALESKQTKIVTEDGREI